MTIWYENLPKVYYISLSLIPGITGPLRFSQRVTFVYAGLYSGELVRRAGLLALALDSLRLPCILHPNGCSV